MTLNLFLWASLPAILISIYIARRDLFPEPKRLIVTSVVLGFLIFIPHTILFTIIREPYLDLIYGNIDNEVFLNLLECLFQAAYVEETFKYLMFLIFVTRFSAFNEPMDAIVYGICISLGFSLMETLEWSRFYLIDYGESTAIAHAQSRAWSSNTMHAGCGIVMGYILSNAFFKGKKSFIKLFLALFIPILIHGFYNFSIQIGAAPLSYLFLIICAAIVLFGWKQTRERQKLKKMEPEDKVLKLNFLNVSGSLILNLLIVSSIIYIAK